MKALNKKGCKWLVSLLIAFVIMFQTTTYVYADTTVNLLYLQDLTYRNNIGNISEAMRNAVQYPFRETWGITFTASVGDLASITPLNSCTKTGVNTFCTCGTPCSNSISTLYHHTNAYKNMDKVIQTSNISGYDIAVVLASTGLCGIIGSSHVQGIGGLAHVGGLWAYCSSLPNSMTTNTRVIQHEISHLYGCLDHSYDGTNKCIMNGGYDDESITTKDVWCDDCKVLFDITLH